MSNVIQWFPGHMTKTLRLIEKRIGEVDMIIEVADARIPAASRSPEVVAATRRKPRIVVLNKSDLADDEATQRWVKYLGDKGAVVCTVSAKQQNARAKLKIAIDKLVKDTGLRLKFKPRAMIVGVPNSGKSTLINTLGGVYAAKTEDRPGVTRGPQWIVLDYAELLDMPGVLSKKFEERATAELLAYTGAIRDEVLDMTDLACSLLAVLKVKYADRLRERYSVTDDDVELEPWELLERIAANRGMLQKGGVPDSDRAAITLIDEFRGGKLGKITLEEPRRE